MNGIEMMIINILGGIGLDPKEIMAKATSLIDTVETKLDNFDKRLGRIESALGIVNEKGEVINRVIEDDKLLEQKLHENIK